MDREILLRQLVQVEQGVAEGKAFIAVPPVIVSTDRRVEDRALDGDLALIQGDRPEALPGLAHQRAEADALVRAHLVLVVGVVHLIGEAEDVAGVSPLGARIGAGEGPFKRDTILLSIGSPLIFQVRSGAAVTNSLMTLSRAASRPFCGSPTVTSR